MDPNTRLRLNFGGINDNSYGSSDRSMYPTTSSTFPQPFSPAPNVQQDYLSPRLTSPASNLGQGYFMNNQYPPQQLQQQQQNQYISQQQQPQPQFGQLYQQQQQQQQQQHTLPTPQAAYQPQPPSHPTDGTGNLVQQFSNQDLGGNRGMFARTPSPAQRPRTAGSAGQQQQPYASHLAPPMPSRSPNPEIPEEPPEKNPSKYSNNVYARGKVINNMVREVFESNVVRARERNTR